MNGRFALTLVLCGLFSLATVATAQEQPGEQQQPGAQQQPTRQGAEFGRQASGPAFRAKDLIGMTVKNAAAKELGTIHDLVVTQNGQIRYAALSRGGVVGIGEKLYAIPWEAFQVRQKTQPGRPGEDTERVELGFRGATEVQSAEKN